MKKIDSFTISSIIGLGIGYAAIIRLLLPLTGEKMTGFQLPGGFPSTAGFLVIWAFLFILWGIGCFFVYSIKLSPRRKRNIFLNSLILIIGIFIWHFLVFSAANFTGALAVSIAILLLAVVVWFMYLVTHRYGGYLFTPMIVWLLFQLYLSIALVRLN